MKHYFRFFEVHAHYLYQYNLYYRKLIGKVMKELEVQFDDKQLHFARQQQKRIRLYSYVALYVNDCFATLKGRRMREKEVKHTLYLSLLTPLLDDLTDNYNLSSVQILEQLHQIDPEQPQHIQVAAYLYNKIREGNEHDIFPHIFKDALLSQDESLKQLRKTELDYSTLMQITCAKGSLWTLLFRLMLDHPLKVREKKAVEGFGAIIQLTNDIFDVYKDTQNGQQTCFTNTRDIALLQEEYGNRLREVIQNFNSLSCQKKDINNTLSKLLIIPALGKVCLDQLKTCQEESGGIFIANTYSRKQLVCDMEKWGNRQRYLKESLQLYSWK